jgi:hypothetical protein
MVEIGDHPLEQRNVGFAHVSETTLAIPTTEVDYNMHQQALASFAGVSGEWPRGGDNSQSRTSV